MRVVLCTLNSRFSHSSLALRYLRATIESDWPDLHLLEFQIKDDLRRITAEIGHLKPDVLAFSCYIWNIQPTLVLATDLKAVFPQMKIVLGGPEVGPRAKELLAQHSAIDFIVQGEGEIAFPALLRAIASRQQPINIAGVYYQTAANSIAGTPPRLVPQEQLPSPYRASDLAELAHKIVYYETSRGCPFRCTYCLSGGDQVRFLPIERVFADLQLLLAANIPLIKFIDRTFNCNPKRALRIMQFLLENRQQSRFHFEICADILDDTMLDFLTQVPADIFQFEIGVQSVNAPTLQAIERRMNWEKLSTNVQRLRAQNNIHLHLDLIAGLPYQDWAAIRTSFDQVIRLQPHMLQLGFLKVLPGTKMAACIDEYGFVISASPPYEVLASKWLTFGELNLLHQIEQLLQNYYNSGLLAYTLPYVWQDASVSPFDWFKRLAHHWQSAGLFQVAHGREALFSHLETYLAPAGTVADLITIDKARCLASFPANFRLPDNYRAGWEDYLQSNLAKFAPRTYKQAWRSVFPVTLQAETLTYLGAPAGSNVAVVDRDKQQIVDFICL
ncbi:MAG: DUF4080 domain-containing protein [Firmicutes bacterium]|nr:DUF4080 domain-containing protein [Bacillota bacterium]